MRDMEVIFRSFKWNRRISLKWKSIMPLILFISACSTDIDINDLEKEIDCSYLLNRCICLVEKDVIALDDSVLFISRDLGNTWKKGPTIEEGQFVRLAYLFKDGTLFFCTDEECYYSTDYVTVNKSATYDIDGSFFSPESDFHSFSAYEHDGIRQIINNEEVLCWGNYNNEEDINPGFIPRIWLTTDNGVSVKCVLKFGTSVLNNDVIKARHVHAINYNPRDSSLWVSTGDDSNTSHWIRGRYSNSKGSIEWELIGTGLAYKTGNIQFYQGWIYASKDSRPGGVFRVKYEDASSFNKQETLFETPNDCLSVYVGHNGDIVAIMTTTGGDSNPRNIYYSRDGSTFYEIEAPIPEDLLEYGYSIFYNTWGITEDGKLMSGIRTRFKSPLSRWDFTPSIWLNDVINDAGYFSAFK